jgi:pyoverdine/dityrosine biosynthesis protein Dit1/alpha-ketoglutarate-dependent taurine dioxygenase
MPFVSDSPSTETQVSEILSIIAAYRHRSTKVSDRFSEFVPQLQQQLSNSVSKKEPLRFILPAFPFKAPAEGDKTKSLGHFPDKAEEIALQTLNGFADSIADIYEGGAKVVIVSDASVYGDILKISDADAFAYREGLQKLAKSLDLKHLEFTRPGALAGIAQQEDAQTLEEYSEQVQKTRKLLDGELAPPVDSAEDENVKATSNFYDTALPKTEEPEALKAAMLKRGKAYAKLIASSTQSEIRLSIHESNNVGKITLNLFPPSTNPDFITPWHGAVAVLADASVRVVDVSKVDMSKFDVVEKEGRPWLLREKSDLFNWQGMELDFEPLFPCGMKVSPKEGSGPYKFEDVDMKLVRRLALATAPLLLRGFSMEVEKEVFRGKARELGSIQQWPFGDILEVTENPEFNMNNVLTREAMPFHYDGVFLTKTDEKTGEVISIPPLFQMFRNRAAKQQVGGLTLFSSSRNFIPLLSDETIPLEELRKLKWKTFTAQNQAFGGQQLLLPFIASHPETGADTFRFHEPWPESKCVAGSSEPTFVEVVGWPTDKGDALCEKLTRILYDRRVAYRHQWTEGDFIFNDNATTHHTRTAFESGHRCLWRVHVN